MFVPGEEVVLILSLDWYDILDDSSANYVVLEMDPDDLIVERDEDNNRAVWNQEVEVLGELNLCGSCTTGGRLGSTLGWTLALIPVLLLRRGRR